MSGCLSFVGRVAGREDGRGGRSRARWLPDFEGWLWRDAHLAGHAVRADDSAPLVLGARARKGVSKIVHPRHISGMGSILAPSDSDTRYTLWSGLPHQSRRHMDSSRRIRWMAQRAQAAQGWAWLPAGNLALWATH